MSENSVIDYVNALKVAMQQEKISDRMSAVKTLLNSADKGALQTIIDRMEDKHLDYFLELQSSVVDGTYDTMQEVSRLEYMVKDMDNDEERDTYIRCFLYFYLNFPGPNELIEFYNEQNSNLNDLFNKYKKTLTKKAEGIIDYMKNTISDINWFFSAAFARLPEEEQNKIKTIYGNGKLLFKYNTENQSFEYDDQVTNIMMEKILEHLQKKNVRNVSSLGPNTSSQPPDYDTVFNKFGIQNEPKYKEATSKNPEKKHTTINEEIGKEMIPRPAAIEKQRKQKNKNKRRTEKSFGINSAKYNLPGKKGGQTKRKIRRNKKTKTKKRKVNKKTKKRKTNKKTKVNRKKSKRKTNKRRTKK